MAEVKPRAARPDSLVRQVHDVIRAQGLLVPGEAVVVAVSGGRDSMVLLDVLSRLAPTGGWRLTVAHFNHRLRGRASDADARQVQDMAARRGWPCRLEEADVRRVARDEGVSVEMAARRLRHAFLARTAKTVGAAKVVLGHHADDQVETFFLRVLRGAGVDGLAGMKFASPSPAAADVLLVRPCLEVPMAELAAYARRHRIAFREDASNRNLDTPRNRVRHQFLPLLRRTLQPALATTVTRLMAVLGDEAGFVAAAADRWLAESRRSPFERLAVAVQRRVIHEQLRSLGIEPTFEWVERLRQAAGRSITVPPGRQVRRTMTGELVAGAPLRAAFVTDHVKVPIKGRKGRIEFGGLAVSWSRRRWTARLEEVPKGVPGQEWLDADRVGETLVLRHWQPGDRFQPSGFERPAKLQDLFTNARVPRLERHRRVVAVAADGGVCWVEGLRLGEGFKVRKDTRRILEWRWTSARFAETSGVVAVSNPHRRHRGGVSACAEH